MNDQAAELRNLMLKQRRLSSPAPYLALVAAGKQSVGATTMTVGLAIALAEEGQRVVLVDTDLNHGDAASRCGLTDSPSIAEVVRSGVDIHEVLQLGPAGILVAPGSQTPGVASEFTEPEAKTLCAELRALGAHADIVLIDAGRRCPIFRSFCSVVDSLILTATSDAAALMSTYAQLKEAVSCGANRAASLLINRSTDVVAEAAWTRLNQSCMRKLNIELELFGAVPQDSLLTKSAKDWNLHPESTSGRQAIERLAEILARRCEERNEHNHQTALRSVA